LVEIIPRGEVSLWLAAFGALVVATLGNTVFEIVRGLAFLRIESRMDERLQTAVWSRLLSLPAPFFRRYTAGDLADRANAVAAARRSLTGAAVQGAMGAIFSVFSLALLFYYSGMRALLVLAMLLSFALASWTLSIGQLRHLRATLRARGELNGFVLQVIRGLAKLRVANTTSHALARWAERYAEQKAAGLAALRWGAGQQVLNRTFHPLALVAVFAVVHYVVARDRAAFDLAAFLSFNAAFGQLAGAVWSLTTAATTLVDVIPLLERLRPILDVESESASGGIDPGDLKGDIEFDNVSFRYAAGRSRAVDGVSFRIRQGDYVALVGPSGCGKSTIYRLLLGFEAPDSGAVFLDGHNLTSLDLQQVRKRLGVVLQNGQIVAGDIFENIAGVSSLSEEEAWEAVRAAALEDDIRAMPMGLRTVLPEGGTGLSVGQKQRLLIARALARKPRVLLFDEATSALDNRAQARVQESLRKLSITRLVIAHRLSSIRDVDRIYVIDAGRIVESGTYERLIRRDGVFAGLARRQLVEG
ncbi:MAG: ATP-binding cassette domain-containing protein, partial [Acidobacteria bacterium]|nr:ATP-binding cassette domain-containing protein [Acidobacteriota bacterium]